jgi:ABC-type oligopeptide transport system ATPase subunit
MSTPDAIKVGETFRAERASAAVRALDNVNFRVAEKEFCALLGHSGCGKTTL